MLAKERTTGREPPPYQNLKYEDDNVRFLATGDAKAFEVLARRFLGPEVGSVQHQVL